MSHSCRCKIHANQHVYPIMKVPKLADIHPSEVIRLPKDANYLSANDGATLLVLLVLLFCMMFILLFCRHCLSSRPKE